MISIEKYNDMYDESFRHPEKFWTDLASKLVWTKPWTQLLNMTSTPCGKWFVGGELNVCFNLLDRHVMEGNGDRTAFFCESAFTKEKKTYSYETVLHEVSRLGGALKNFGVSKGSIVFIFLPKIPEALMTALACARIGAVYSFINGAESVSCLTEKIQHAMPSLVVTTTVGLVDRAGGSVFFKKVLDTAVSLCQVKSLRALVLKRGNLPKGFELECEMVKERDTYWHELMAIAEDSNCLPMESNEALHLCYTSGTTGNPKVAVHTSLTLVTALCRNELEMNTREHTLFSPKELSLGPPYRTLLYSAMTVGASALLFEGELYGDQALDILRLMSDYKVRNVVTTFRSFMDLRHQITSKGQLQKYSFECLSKIDLVGEVPDPSMMKWLADTFGCSVTSGYGQTESGGIGRTVGSSELDVLRPLPGVSLKIVPQEDDISRQGQRGRLLLKLPLCPGFFTTLLKDDEKCKKLYFSEYPGYYDTCDECVLFEDGSFRVLGRADDTILVATTRFVPSVIEDVVRSHPAVLDCFVGAVPNSLYRHVPYAVYTSNDQLEDYSAQEAEIVSLVNDTLGVMVHFGGAIRIESIPLNPMDKINRRKLQAFLLENIQASKL